MRSGVRFVRQDMASVSRGLFPFARPVYSVDIDDSRRTLDRTMARSPQQRSTQGTERSAFRPLGRNELLAIFGFWTFMALLAEANHLVDPGGGRTSAGIGQHLALEFFEAYLWAILTVLVFWVVGRLRVERTRWVKPLLILGALGLASAIFVDVVENLFEIHALGLDRSAGGTSPIQSLRRMWFLNDLMIYVAILAAAFARDYFFRYRSRQEQAIRLQGRAAVLEAQLAEARLEALRMQVNPHFLFNTLHAVSSLVHRDPDGVRRMIAKLANLLRTTLRGGTEPEVSLERELEFLEDYLEIMRIRFQGRLDVEFDVAPGLLHALVPNLILQPLVENAVKHGVAKTTDPAQIVITAAAEDHTLVLRVFDSGPGLTTPDPAEEPGIGIRNVRERLAQLYGDGARLILASRPEGGARAEVRLPLRTAEGEPAAIPVVATAGPEGT